MLKRLLSQARFKSGSFSEQSCPEEWVDDPVAQKTAWSPEKAGGASFRTHRLESLSVTRMEFRLTLGAKLFCWLFTGMGVGIPLAIAIRAIQEPGTEFASVLLMWV